MRRGSGAVNDGLDLAECTEATHPEPAPREYGSFACAGKTQELERFSRAPRVSIIVSNYNYERYVGAAVDSALAQSVPDCEIIVVDDGSTDGSRAVLERYSGDPRIRVVLQKNGGQAVAMNVGFAVSTGDIVIFLDSDDTLHPNAVETILCHWRPGLSRCQYALEVIDGNSRRLGLHPCGQAMEDGDVHWKLVVGGYYRFMPTSGNAFARAALLPIFPIPEQEWRICSDTYLVNMSTAYGAVRNIDVPLGCYRVHGSNNWYRDVRDPEHLHDIWRLHFQVWHHLTRRGAIAPSTADDESMRARDADMARLHVYRRLLTGYFFQQGAVPPDQVRTVRREVLRATLASRLPFRHKLLYLGWLALVGTSQWRAPAAKKWNAHSHLRPAWLKTAVEWLKGEDFYDWMKRRPMPEPIATFPIARDIRFGRRSEGELHLWYGWDRSFARHNWTIARQAAIVGQLPDDCGDIDVELELAPFLAHWVKAQRLVIDINGCKILDRRLTKKETVRFSLSRALAKRGQALVIGLECPTCIASNQIHQRQGDYLALGFKVLRLRIDEHRSESGAAAGSYVPLGQDISMADPDAGNYLTSGWHEPEGGVARMARRMSSMRMSVLNGAGDPLLLTLRLAGMNSPMLHRCALRIDAGGSPVAVVDAAVDREVSIFLRRGVVPDNGALELKFATDNLVAPAVGGEHRPAGPGLRSFTIERLAIPVPRPAFMPGFVYSFAAKGAGLQFRGPGWYDANAEGLVSNDVEASVAGSCATRLRYVFVTAIVYPAFSAPSGAAQEFTIAANGVALAAYEITERAEVTAIVPADLIGPDRLLTLQFRVAALVRPVDLGTGDDRLPMGIGLAMLKVE
jgi:glycosyltransferase involved in cell wall biosynthesis